MGVSKDKGNGKPLLKWDDLGGKPTIFGNIHVSNQQRCFFWLFKNCTCRSWKGWSRRSSNILCLASQRMPLKNVGKNPGGPAP